MGVGVGGDGSVKLHVGFFRCAHLREGLGEEGSGKSTSLTASMSVSLSVVEYLGLHLMSVLVQCSHSSDLRTPERI